MIYPFFIKQKIKFFCYSGINEEAGEFWECETDDHIYTEKYPHEIGKFCFDIIAGHIHTFEIAEEPYFNEIYYDGYSHYYIDSDFLKSEKLSILMYDTKIRKYYSVSKDGDIPIYVYDSV